jgi:PAS domain S-box-containing protein
MKLADRIKISSVISLGMLAIVVPLLIWSSGELKIAENNDILADDIQGTIFERVTLRDSYFFFGVERAKVQWLSLTYRTRELLQKGARQFTGREERRVLQEMQKDFDETAAIFQRLTQRAETANHITWQRLHDDKAARLFYTQIMIRASALQRGAGQLQLLTRERSMKAVNRIIALSAIFVFLMLAVTILDSSLVRRLLRRRLETLRSGAAMIATGDLDFRIDCHGSNELSELGTLLNIMTAKVQDYTRQLKSSHDLLNDLSAQVPGILFQTRLTPEGEFSTPYASGAINEIYELSSEEVAKDINSIFDTFHPDDRDGIFASIQQSAQTLKPWEHEYRVVLPGRVIKWLRGHARPMREPDGGTLWHGFITDVTERKLMEDALQSSEKRFRLQLQELTNIYDHSPVGLFAVDRDLRFLRLNECMANINGKTVDQHLGRSIDEALPDELAARLKEIWRPVLEQGQSALDVELEGTVWSSQDLPRQWLANYHPLQSDSGEVIGITGTVLDITARKNAELVLAGIKDELEHQVSERTASLFQANRQLIREVEERKKGKQAILDHQQKLQTMALDLSMAEERERDRIAGELHDQVGQRLILVKMKLGSLASQLTSASSESEADCIEALIDQSIQDIRSLTFQIRPPLLASAGLEAALRWLGEELRNDFGLRVDFSSDSSRKPLRYEVRSVLFQATRELLLNVVKHAGTRRCRLWLTRLEDFIVIVVEDDGVGFKTEPYAKQPGRTGGFGLYNVRQRIEYLNGNFAVEAKATGGTRITVMVPLDTTDEAKEG